MFLTKLAYYVVMVRPRVFKNNISLNCRHRHTACVQHTALMLRELQYSKWQMLQQLVLDISRYSWIQGLYKVHAIVHSA